MKCISRSISLLVELVAIQILGVAAACAACHSIEGTHLRASDLSRVYADFAAAPQQETLGLAPSPGSRRIVTTRDLALAARRWGIEPRKEWAEACFESKTTALDVDQVTRALHGRLRELAGIAVEVKMEVIDQSRFRVPPGAIEFPGLSAAVLTPDRADGSRLVRGVIRYGERRSFPIWVRVKIRAEQQVPVAVRELAPGTVLAESDVAWEPRTNTGAVAKPQEIVGRSARRRIAAGQVIAARNLGVPPAVQSGEMVEVEVRAGLAKLRLTSQAETGGRTGERILMRNQSTGRKYSAEVVGPGKAVVRIGGK